MPGHAADEAARLGLARQVERGRGDVLVPRLVEEQVQTRVAVEVAGPDEGGAPAVAVDEVDERLAAAVAVVEDEDALGGSTRRASEIACSGGAFTLH